MTDIVAQAAVDVALNCMTHNPNLTNSGHKLSPLTGVTLFASAGIADLALEQLGVKMIVANELLPDRASLFSRNYPQTQMVQGDIWETKNAIIKAAEEKLGGHELDVLLATPPCQGMSSAGLGKLLAEVRAGNRPKMDPRNRLIIPTLDIAIALRPRLIVFENVPGMGRTPIINEEGQVETILQYITRRLGPDYVGNAEVVEFADYGVPQRRQRLITIYTRDESLKRQFEINGTFIPEPTHAKTPTLMQQGWKTLRDAISHYPELDAVPGKNARLDYDAHHSVPVLDPKKYEWIRHTPPNGTAFNNQCINPGCLYQYNTVHGARVNAGGINQSNRETPLFCENCASLLPRPYVETNGKKRIMRGFISAYKRMAWDLPAPTLTQNFAYPSSDHNIHPSQNRVLSIAEALTVHTVSDYHYNWSLSEGKPASATLIRDVIGESVPPKGLESVLKAPIHAMQMLEPVRHDQGGAR